ncbi:MAG TPA: protein-export chaperone SecB [Acholeplasma sp.]|jgi:preprotein translocase subunit SecB
MKVQNTLIQTKHIKLVNHNLKGNYKLNPIFTKQLEKVDDRTYILTISVSVVNTPTEPFPIDLSCSISGTFTFDEADEIQIENFLQIPAIQVLYPHMRSMIASVTTTSYMQPLLLPLVDARMFKNV